ncbi:MAG: lipoyl(octanoyl) transferase LipB [Rhodospirillaceae bacterium]|nr:MAG: lipoyl(octanoyl) transferase LipB [Rhodospirillaceae bacterium]
MSNARPAPQIALPPVEIQVASTPISYPEAVATMEARVAAISTGQAREQLWFVEHPPLYTAGTSAKSTDLLQTDRFPVFATGRGGQYTYHGPGQRVVYVMLDLKNHGMDVRCFVRDLESWLMTALARLGVAAERRDGRVGLWVVRSQGVLPSREDKIAAIGVRIRRWVSFHGIALNVTPDLSHYAGIVPCGISQHGVTSLRDLGLGTTMAEADAALLAAFEDVFGRSVTRS